MFLATDIGNSNIVIAIHNGKEWIHKYRYETKDDQPIFFYESGLRDIFLEWRINPADIKKAAISSVVPEVTEKIITAVANNIRFRPTLLSPELFLKLNMKIPKIYEIGADLVANAYAANKIYAQNTIIVDFGTALTFTIYEHSKGIKGVTIAPGLKTISSTLSNNTAQLPQVDIVLPNSAIGTSTSTAIRAGILFGFIGMVKEIISRIKAELNDSYIVVATGGHSGTIKDIADQFDYIDKELTLSGIKFISEIEID